MEAAVEVDDVAIAYADAVALHVDRLVLPRERSTAVIGPNGSGKTTLLAALSGLTPVTSGTLRVLGGAPGQQRERVAHVLQETANNAALPVSVAEVVRMGRYARLGAFGRLTATDRDAVRRAMDRTGISTLDDRHLSELSAGQRQRVFVAQALAQEADLLLLDEPSTNLDLPAQERLSTLLSEELALGRTVVTTTHDVGEAARADHVVLLNGELVAAGPPDVVLTPANLDAAYGHQVHVTDHGTVVIDDPHHG